MRHDVDNLLSANVVLADGKQVRASERKTPIFLRAAWWR
jgi:hypothetical protein